MTASRRQSARAVCWARSPITGLPAPRRRERGPGPGSPDVPGRRSVSKPAGHRTHPLTRTGDNARLMEYEQSVKQAFDCIVPVLKDIAARQHDRDFESQAQQIALSTLGFRLPDRVLDRAWVDQLDMRTLYAWAVFETYRRFARGYFDDDPMRLSGDEDFDAFLQSCGFHRLDVSPCADGRLAHVVRYVLRLPPGQVRRRSYAGALFDVEDSLNRWVETELNRFREGVPNTADEPTRYLKAAVYHYSSQAPDTEGCAAHGSDRDAAAAAALARLTDFQQAIQNSFCCGASIDLLLLGVDTDTDTLCAHVPDGEGVLSISRYVSASDAYARTRGLAAGEVDGALRDLLADCAREDGATPPVDGMARLIVRLIGNNFSQIDYVGTGHDGAYPDIGHQERFIGAGSGFDEIQLRNLTYFAHLQTVEEAAADLDVGVRIFSGLNVSRGLPVPVVLRFDYRGDVPGARARAEARCARVNEALQSRYRDLADQGLLHTLMAVRDCAGKGPIEILGSSLDGLTAPASGAH